MFCKSQSLPILEIGCVSLHIDREGGMGVRGGGGGLGAADP